jgi:23S rRNA (adenine-N6)-dimethyltransferase
VIAVELHPGRAASLRRRFDRDAVTVVTADVRRVRWPRRPFTVVANPPWSALEEIRAALERQPRLRAAHLVVPRWLARRWDAAHPHVLVAGSVRAEAFTPPAPTGAAVVVLRPRGR